MKDSSRSRRLICVEIGDRNLGLAYNVGIEAATQPVVILMDSDCTFESGAIRRLYEGTTRAVLCKGFVRFEHESWASRVIAMSREHHTGDVKNAYSPPLAMRKTISNLIGGHFFDDEIHWCEDHEFDQRVQDAGVEISFDPEAVVVHPPLTCYRDLKSSVRYGMGYRAGVTKEIIRGNWLYGGHRSIGVSVGIDLVRAILSPFYLAQIGARKSWATACYTLLWMAAFATGLSTSIFPGHPVSRLIH